MCSMGRLTPVLQSVAAQGDVLLDDVLLAWTMLTSPSHLLPESNPLLLLLLLLFSSMGAPAPLVMNECLWL